MTTYIKTFSLATDTMTQQLNSKQSVAQYNQGDVNTDTLNMTVTHNNSVMDLTNATVSVVFSKPDGKVVYQDTSNGVTITNATQGQLSIALNTQTRAAAGTVIGAVRITYPGNQTLETEKFSFNVEASLASDQAIASNNDIQALQALIKFKSFTATANQTLFDISDVGSYTQGQNRLFIDVGGAPQGPNNYTETSTTSFTLSEAVPAGTIVNVRWFQGGGAYLGGHNTTHEIGGGDVIDVTKLLNYNEQIATPISNINAQLADITLDVKSPQFGANGDGSTNDTTAINNAFNAIPSSGGTVLIPSGTYMIDALTSLQPKSNTKLILSPGAVLQAITNSADRYAVILLSHVSNVVIQGGTIKGERSTHTGTTGEWGYGIYVKCSSNVLIQQVTSRDCWGDGLFIGEGDNNPDLVPSNNVTVKDSLFDNNRRNGISVVNAHDVLIDNCISSNTNGTAPQAGIDLEPNASGSRSNYNITVQNCTLQGNTGDGIDVVYYNQYNIKLLNNDIISNASGINVNTIDEIMINNNFIKSHTGEGIYLGQSTRASVSKNTIDTAYIGLFIETNTADSSFTENKILSCSNDSIAVKDCSNILIQSNEVKDGTGRGINFTNKPTNVSVLNNIFKNITGDYWVLVNPSPVVINEVRIENNFVIGCKGGYITGQSHFSFSNNTIRDSTSNAVYIENCSFVKIKGNKVKYCQGNGLQCYSLTNSIVSENMLVNNGLLTDNTYSNLYLSGTSKDNLVAHNTLRVDSAQTNQSGYGIRFDGTSINNIVTNNDAYNGGKSSGLSLSSANNFMSSNRNKDGTYSATPN